MAKNILILQGHPDAGSPHLGHALTDAYVRGAKGAGHALRRLDIAHLEFPLLRSQEDWEHGSVPPGLAQAQADILWAEHIVLLFPLWLGDMPALVKAFLEQVLRPGFAFHRAQGKLIGEKALRGRSARIVVPAAVYRWYFRAHSVRMLERNILGFVGIGPVNETLVGMVAALDARAVRRWSARLARLGEQAG